MAEHRHSGAACTVLTARLADPTGYGRIVRVGKDDRIARIVEHRDATAEEREIDEINTGIFCFRRSLLAPALRMVSPDNAQGEYYLTDVVEVLAEAGHRVVSVVAADPDETHGINDRAQLAHAEAELRSRTNADWLAKGVTMVDPAATYIDTTVSLAADVTLFPGTILQGRTVIGEGVEIGPGCRLVDCTVGEHTTLEHTVARLSDDRRRLRDRSVRRARAGRAHSVGDPHRAVLHCRGGRGARRLTVRPPSAHSGQRGPMELVTKKRLHLLAGRSNLPLAEEIADHLGVELGHPNLVEFANGEIHSRLGENVRGADVFIIQTHGATPRACR